MRFLQKQKTEKTILVISDIHLGAGSFVKGRRNNLEDFFHDKELVDFLDFYSSGEFKEREVELIINGDFFDLLAVPFVDYFDDEFWSEEASLEKLKLIIEGHSEVFEALIKFIEQKNKKIVYIIGNHDAELVFESLRNYVLKLIPLDRQTRFIFKTEQGSEYCPIKEVVIKHGHEYEFAHNFHHEDSLIRNHDGKKYFVPPWGSYYVTRVVNKYKEERDYVNQIRPIKFFLIRGLIYDTLFTLRFLFSTCFYFLMVRFLGFLKRSKNAKVVWNIVREELRLFKSEEENFKEFFEERPEVKLVVVGHTHDCFLKNFDRDKAVINTGTWTNMHFLEMGKSRQGALLTYAEINELKDSGEITYFLNYWEGRSNRPYKEYYLSNSA